MGAKKEEKLFSHTPTDEASARVHLPWEGQPPWLPDQGALRPLRKNGLDKKQSTPRAKWIQQKPSPHQIGAQRNSVSSAKTSLTRPLPLEVLVLKSGTGALFLFQNIFVPWESCWSRWPSSRRPE